MKANLKEFLKWLKKDVKDNAGPACKVFDMGCIVCRANLALRTLQDLSLVEDNLQEVKTDMKPEATYTFWLHWLYEFLSVNVGSPCPSFSVACERCNYWLAWKILADINRTNRIAEGLCVEKVRSLKDTRHEVIPLCRLMRQK